MLYILYMHVYLLFRDIRFARIIQIIRDESVTYSRSVHKDTAPVQVQPIFYIIFYNWVYENFF